MFLVTFFLSLLSWFPAPEATYTEPANVFISTNKGKSWEGFAKGLPEDLSPRDVLEHEGSIYLTAFNDGMYVLEPDSDTWEIRNTGLPVTNQFNDLPLGKTREHDFFPSSFAAKGDQLILGTFNRGVFVSNDKGKSWVAATTNIDDVVSALLFVDDLLIAGTHSGIWQSEDQGVNWELRCETGFRINALALHNNQLHVARQNGMGILTNNNLEWSDMKTGWAIIQLQTEGDQLYAITAKEEVFRTTTGEVWENNKFAVKGLPANSLMEAIWGGLSPKLPNEISAGVVSQTSRGWIVSAGGGC